MTRFAKATISIPLVMALLFVVGCSDDDQSVEAGANQAPLDTVVSATQEIEVPSVASPKNVSDNREASDVGVSSEPDNPFELVDGFVGHDEYDRELRLGGMVVHWSNDEELLWMALVAPATGYVTVGFDPVNRKVGANYIIGYVKDGETVIRDHVGTRGNLHDADINVGGVDNLLATAGSEIDGVTILEFVIPLDSGDSKDRPLIPGKTYEIQVAYQSNRDDFISWHSRHGIGEFTLDAVDD